ncbi:hypothetical protein AA23498_1873 [Acetobacter nitrogenifigens DSM 23921 = NBRC 105050]|uniref:NlpC/P60 domain-containing protein n=2 Tax=Acetobacter TaxID=434 RepID=A0A511XCF6_9PROT|nr:MULTISPECIES: hypothetical protein [Acetobacter]MBO1359098.1 hypothetical protein [Acetobacter sacchari]GBQ93920.1 hypothetical protein AA23498_1873 [Acetobacter nitrogenifigens DSM 23921 = NBRC 105050]GEN60620.1 hypothetical protein ANI02nite_25040 [Acetobacter nitrogenifigens DSM 23921 = NBRC 105050]
MNEHYPIIAIAEKRWEAHKSDCSGFVRAVAKDLGVPMTGLANQLVDAWRQDGMWTKLNHDHARASLLSAQGYLVVAGLQESGHGHVVIVIPGKSNHGDAMGYWGRLGGTGYKNKGLNFAWKRADLKNVEYFARFVPALAMKP